MSRNSNEENRNVKRKHDVLHFIEKYSLLPEEYLQREVKKLEEHIYHFSESKKLFRQDHDILCSLLKPIYSLLNKAVLLKKNRIIKDYKRRKKRTLSKLNPAIEAHQASLFSSNLPLPITGEIKITGLTEELQALRKSEIHTKPKFPYKLPTGIHWNEIIIKFLNDENIEIHVNRIKHTTSYIDMGMIGKGKPPKPNEQWIFLKVLAQYNGEITINDTEARDKYKMQKHLLSKTLQQYFSIDYDPFYPYHSTTEKQGHSYKIKLTLIPPPQRDKTKSNDIETDPLGIDEYLKEETQLI